MRVFKNLSLKSVNTSFEDYFECSSVLSALKVKAILNFCEGGLGLRKDKFKQLKSIKHYS